MFIEDMPQRVRSASCDVRFIRIVHQPECLVLVAGPADTAGVKQPQIRIGSIQFECSGRRTDRFVEISELHERERLARPSDN